MEGWHTTQDEKQGQQTKSVPVNQAENEIALTIQGQRTVQDIVDKAVELFRRLQNFKLSSDSSLSRQSQSQSREIRDTLTTLKALFAKVRKIHDETKTRVNMRPGESLPDIIPFKHESKETPTEVKVDDGLVKEHQQLQQTLKKKNDQLQEVMDALRTMIWDINTMVALKPS